MQEKNVNMQDIRNEIGVKSIRWKVEKRAYERIGHIMRMSDDRQVKAVTLGWLKDLENFNKKPGRKRKTILYWKRLVREAGWDYSRIGMLTNDKKEWKSRVRSRMKYVEEWERKGGKRFQGDRGERNQTLEEESLVCEVEGCGKVCKSKAGLTIHRKRMHEESKEKVTFTCEMCQETFKQEANLLNHKKSCTGLRASSADKRKCDKCLREYAKKSFSAHYKRCGAAPPSERPVVSARVYVSERAMCVRCRRWITKSNMSRHQKICD